MGTDDAAVVYGAPNLLDRLMPDGYKLCRKCMGTGRIADFDDLNDMGTIRFEPCDVCGGSGFINEELFDALEASVEEDD